MKYFTYTLLAVQTVCQPLVEPWSKFTIKLLK